MLFPPNPPLANGFISSTEENKMVKHNVKIMKAFFSFDWFVHHEFVSREQNVNNEFFQTILQSLHNTLTHITLRSGAPTISNCNMTMAQLTALTLQKNF